MGKITKISVLLIFIVCVVIIPNFSMAVADSGSATTGGGTTAVTPTNQMGLGDLNSYVGGGSASTTFATRMSRVAGTLTAIGVVTSVVGLIVIGIKYMLGSVEEKADYKKTMIPYIVGCFLVFTVSLIPQLIYIIMSNF